MNEQLRQLMLEAGYAAPELAGRANKLAELIVKECMNQVREQYLPVLEDELMMKDTHRDGYVQCGVDSYVAIKQHFGVEE
jgi:hypothetical protein